MKAQDDLQLFDYLKDLNQKGEKIFSKNKLSSRILPIAQKCLKTKRLLCFGSEIEDFRIHVRRAAVEI